MKARPILFSGPMVRALLDGRKTQTRRVMKWNSKSVFASYSSMPPQCLAACPYGKSGNLLAVKESAWMWCERRPNGKTKTGRPKWRYAPLDSAPIHYQADHPEKPMVSITHPETGNHWGWRLKLGRFLPRWASRLTLELTEVRVERLQDISETDAEAEGAEPILVPPDGGSVPHVEGFQRLWASINGPGSWDANNWVWVLGFRVHHQNVDAFLAAKGAHP